MTHICPTCGKEISDTTFFRTVFDYGSTKYQSLMTSPTSVIHQWREKGYSFETHVKPAIDAVRIHHPSWSYINGIIQNTLKPMAEAPAQKKLSAAEIEANKEWKRQHGLYVA